MKLRRVTTEYPEKGKKYFCNYWFKSFECIDVVDVWNHKEFICKWEDGHITQHCTKFDKKDMEIIEK